MTADLETDPPPRTEPMGGAMERLPRRLDPVECRVLGALLEKEQTTPEYYPMTVNALIAACNQRTNRDPVTDLEERDVRAALNAIPPLPSRQDFEEVARRLRGAQDGLTPKVLELREADDWQRWANVGVQEQLIGKMEALKALDDHGKAYPDGILSGRRDVLRVIATCTVGRVPAAREQAEKYLADHPRSTEAARIRRVCGTP